MSADGVPIVVGVLSRGLSMEIAKVVGAHDAPAGYNNLIEYDRLNESSVVTYQHLLLEMIQCDTHDFWRQPVLLRQAFLALDNQNKCMLARGGGDNAMVRMAWAVHHEELLRALWSHFKRLCTRSPWSHSAAIAKLKTRFFNRARDHADEAAGPEQATAYARIPLQDLAYPDSDAEESTSNIIVKPIICINMVA